MWRRWCEVSTAATAVELLGSLILREAIEESSKVPYVKVEEFKICKQGKNYYS